MDDTHPFLLTAVVTARAGQAALLDGAVRALLAQKACEGAARQVLLAPVGAEAREACVRLAAEHPDDVSALPPAPGLAAARNAGLAAARGTHVCFLSAAERPAPGALRCARDFFAAEPDAVLLSFPVSDVEADGVATAEADGVATDDPAEGAPPWRVLVAEEAPEEPLRDVAGCILRAGALGQARFDEALPYAAGFVLVNELVCGRAVFGAASRGLWRRVAAPLGDNAHDPVLYDPAFYTQTLSRAHRALLERARDAAGAVPERLQYAVMAELDERLGHPDTGVLDAEDRAAYREELARTLRLLDTRVIARQRRLSVPLKIFAYALRFGVEASEVCAGVFVKDGGVRSSFYAQGRRVVVYLKSVAGLRASVVVRSIERVRGGVELWGSTPVLCRDCPVEVRFRVDGQPVSSERLQAPVTGSPTPTDGEILPQLGFRCVLPVHLLKTARAQAFVLVAGVELPARLVFGAYAGLTHRARASYRVLDDVLLRLERADDPAESPDAILLERASSARAQACERRLCEELAADPATAHLPALRAQALEARRAKGRSREQLWLVKDHVNRADDNGEALFRHLHDHPLKGVRAVFSLRPDSPDFERLQALGEVVAAGSLEEKLLFFQMDAGLFAYPYGVDVNPFGEDRHYLSDLLDYKHVYLRHGVAINDQSHSVNKSLRNTALIVVSTPGERDWVVQGDYGFREGEVLLSGLPRHDALVADARRREPGRRLYIMPTWRKNLANDFDPLTGTRPRLEGFADSDFCAFYRALIAHPRLNEALERNGWEARFVLHPNFWQEASCFQGTERVEVVTSCNYHEAFLDASCLVTDYSSVCFDFALLKRPIVFSHFDLESFYRNHPLRPGYVAYEQIGFGPVCYDLESTVDAIEQALAADGVMEPDYARNVDDFFFWPDKPRCQIVAEAVYDLVRSTRRGR